ncbi:hypothetical protein [Pectinatus sottacetonis]|uniref:hypothetical protein n=1 Tax=Pectinatus sottacetonis TaxID=1002795 RepID=UPI0018C46522|nr:hypothetical protein [Pectinatus sottacetonis]
MKKYVVIICLLLGCFSGQAVAATATSQPIWEISAVPKPSASETEAMRWTVLFTNDIAEYFLDTTSLKQDKVDKDIVRAEIKAVYTDKALLKKLDKIYKAKLTANDHVAYSEIYMAFKINKSQYTIEEEKIYNKKGVLLADKKLTEKFSPVPIKTLVDTVYVICRNHMRNGLLS